MKRENGFSIIELMIVIVLIAIVSAIAVPSFTSIVKRNRLASQGNDFLASLNIARSEAIKRNLNVMLCRSADGATCAGAGGWDQGWLVFVDVDGSGGLNVGDDTIIVHGKLSNSSTLVPNGTYSTSITYMPRGYVSPAVAGGFVLCPSDGDFTYARAILISATGRPRIADAEATTNPQFTNCNGS